MSLPRARVVRAEDATRAAPLLAPGPSDTQRRRIAREEIEARLASERIVDEARAAAEALVARAKEEAVAAGAKAAREAQESANAELAARWLALRAAEGPALEREKERIVAVAVALAERLLDAALELDPARIADLARAVLAEARGARRAVIHAHPLDVDALRRHLTTAGLGVQTVEVRADEALARGALRLHTDVGIIDAQLSPRLERLAAALRDALGLE
jgi:flagellar biosynthesis/type III secretory pathway protein FliH